MKLKKNYFNLIGILIIFSNLFIFGCKTTNQNSKLAETKPDNPYRSYIYSSSIKKQKPTICLNEYVSRVGKKIVLVTENPCAEYNFKVEDSNMPVKIEENNIILDKTTLKNLDDEAELAAVLANAINRANRNFSKTTQTKEDQEIIDSLSKAGYDPNAVIDLQEKYLNAPYNKKYSWIKSLSKHKINKNRINSNKNFLAKKPKGLQRNKHKFINIVTDD